MSYKTDRLVDLFPDAYAARERESLLYKFLDAVGAELLAADEAVKALLKLHWVDYAQGAALDGLGAIFGVERRRLPDGSQETDEAFRLRLKSVVPLFTGGGTRRAVLGAVRSALGLPFDLAQLNLPEALRQDLENLITLVEFSPNPERLVDEIVNPAQAGQLTLAVPVVSVQAERPRITWTFTLGGGRRLRLERLDSGEGIIAADELIIPQGQTLQLSVRANTAGELQAFLNTVDVSAQFTSLAGGPPLLPEIPRHASDWRFTAEGGRYDVSTFDEDDTFDPPLFRVEMIWQSYTPLTFDIFVPYFLRTAVDNLTAQYGYTGDIFVYEGLDLETIQQVVDRTRAAGVRGSVHFSLNFYEDHPQQEVWRLAGDHRLREDAGANETLTIGSLDQRTETHDVDSRLGLGAVFDVAWFDGDFVFH